MIAIDNLFFRRPGRRYLFLEILAPVVQCCSAESTMKKERRRKRFCGGVLEGTVNVVGPIVAFNLAIRVVEILIGVSQVRGIRSVCG